MKKVLKGKIGWLLFFAVLLVGAGIGGNNLQLGDSSATDKEIEFMLGLGDSNPKIKAQSSGGLSFGDDTNGFSPFGSGSGGSGSGINVLTNPDANININDWTASGGTFSRTTTAIDVGEGAGSFEWDANAASQTLTSDAFTMSENKTLHNRLCTLNFFYKDGDANLKVGAWDGSAYLVEETLATASVYTGSGHITFACPSTGTIALRFESTADAATIRFDSAFLGTSVPLYGAVVTDWKDYTPVYNGFGTVTGSKMQYKRVGDSVAIKGLFTTGAVAASEARVGLPSGLTIASSPIHTTQCGQSQRDASSVFQNITTLCTNDDTYLRFGLARTDSASNVLSPVNANAIFSSTEDVSIKTRLIPVAEWQGTSLAFQPSPDDLSLSPWKASPITTSNFSTDTVWTVASARDRRVGENMEINLVASISSSGAGAENIYFTIPYSLTLDATGMASNFQLCAGFYRTNAGPTHSISCQYDGSGILFRPADRVGASNRLKDDVVVAGDTLSVVFSIPIEGWSVGTVPAVGVEIAGAGVQGLAGPADRQGVIASEVCGTNCVTCNATNFNFGVAGPAMFFGFELNLDPTSSGTNTECDIPLPNNAPTHSFVDAADISGVCQSTSGTPANAVTGVLRASVGTNDIFLRVSNPPSASALDYQCTGVAFKR